jgi:hypothetical protein
LDRLVTELAQPLGEGQDAKRWGQVLGTLIPPKATDRTQLRPIANAFEHAIQGGGTGGDKQDPIAALGRLRQDLRDDSGLPRPWQTLDQRQVQSAQRLGNCRTLSRIQRSVDPGQRYRSDSFTKIDGPIEEMVKGCPNRVSAVAIAGGGKLMSVEQSLLLGEGE